MMSSDNDSNSSPMSYSDMYNDDAYVIDDNDHTSHAGEKKSSDVDYGFDDEDALDFGGRAYNIPYMQDQASVATSVSGQPRISSGSSVSSMPSDTGRRPSSLLGGDDNSVISASPSVDSYGYSAVGSVAGSIGAAVPPPAQIRSTALPTPYHNTAAPSVTGSMSTNPYYESTDGEQDDASVEMSLVTPEPSTPGRKNPFGKSNSTLQDSVKIDYVQAPPPPVVTKAARQSSTTEYPDNPEDEFGVSVVSSLPDDFSVQSSVKVDFVPSPFDEPGKGPPAHMMPTSPLTPVFPDYQQKTLPANAPMAPLPHGQMMDPSIPRPDSDSESGVQVKHHSEYPSQPFAANSAVYAYNTTSSSSEASENGDPQYRDEFLEKNQKKAPRLSNAGGMSVSSSVVTEKPKKKTNRANPFSASAEDPEAALEDGKSAIKEKKKKKRPCLRKCLCIFIPALLLVLGGGGYYAYTKDFFGFDFFGLYESKDDVASPGNSQGNNPENPQDRPANDPQENGGGISFPSSTPPTAAPVVTEPPKGVINDGNTDNGNTDNGNSTNGGDAVGDIPGNSTNTNSTSGEPIGVIGTKQPHLTPIETKAPSQSPSSISTSPVAPSDAPVPAPTPTDATTTPTTQAESEVIIQYRNTIQSYLGAQGISFDTSESSTTVNALDRLMNDIVAAMFQEEETNNAPFYEEFYRVTQRFALYCLGIALEETAAEDYATVLEVAQPWTPRSEPTPMYPLVFERLIAGETKSSDHCNWPGVVCSSGDQPDIVSITWNQQGLDGVIPPEISLLQSITSIDLANNYIHGNIPSQVLELPNLERLVLHHNYLEGQLNLQAASDRLTHLDLGHNLLSGDLLSLESIRGLGKYL